MRHLFAAAGLAAGGTAAAQAPPSYTVAPSPFQMPGVTVGTGVRPVGARLPQVGTQLPKVGTAPGQAISPINPGFPTPTGQPFDPATVVGPYPGMPNPKPSFWQQLEQRWAALFTSDKPAPPSNWTPGLARRNRERAAERRAMGMWWAD